MKSEKLVEGGCVRALGFDNMMPTNDKASETLFFVGAQGERIEGASTEQVNEFIDYWEQQIAIARLYLANGREVSTNKWRIHKVGVR